MGWVGLETFALSGFCILQVFSPCQYSILLCRVCAGLRSALFWMDLGSLIWGIKKIVVKDLLMMVFKSECLSKVFSERY